MIRQQFKINFSYPVFFVDSFFDREKNKEDIFAQCGIQAGSKFLFVIDNAVVGTDLDLVNRIENYFKNSPYKLATARMIVGGGETAKNDFGVLQNILSAIDENKMDRHSYVVAIGGGAVLDVVGFAAAISHRGIRHIRFPSTVLSQNDSGVGVKNGINYFGKKNFLGTFAPPFAVINDCSFLKTLDDRDFRCGIAEAIKVALVKDADFFDFIEKHADELNNRDEKIIKQLIYVCASMHLQHIASVDPFEQGSSRPLDYGHWSAHKIEQLSKYEIRHGEAVVIGMCLDAVYSNLIGKLSEKELLRLINLSEKLNFKLFANEMENNLLEGLQEFREHLGGELTIMLLEKIGKGIEVHEVHEQLMMNAVGFLKNFKS
ncbi:MAG: 3-dehydroquinate synthase [Bacteroidetes bacterium]|nr:3-dehydroquinate synthase [Bacteroidota bacterium]